MGSKRFMDRFDRSWHIFYFLIAKRVCVLLLVSSPYDAFIMEEDGRLAGRILHEYKGLNLTRPPRISWASSADDALKYLQEKPFDLVITMLPPDDMGPVILCSEIKRDYPNLPVYYLAHDTGRYLIDPEAVTCGNIDRRFVWLGNTDLLVALIKSTEDMMNVSFDTQRARVRVILLVEDSPLYLSSLLPAIYKQIVQQTQAAMDDSMNEEHRILRMRARPKILVAESYEAAEQLYEQYKPFVLSVLSDVRFPRGGRLDENAGVRLLAGIKAESPGLPVLLLSSELANKEKADGVPANFINKNSTTLHQELSQFFDRYLGFGDFIFRTPDGRELARAANLREMEDVLPSVPEEIARHLAEKDAFSTWLMARSEIELASDLRPVKVSDFDSGMSIRDYLVSSIRTQRRKRQKGVVIEFSEKRFDPLAEFVKIGSGSLGGKARGLAFMASVIRSRPDLQIDYPGLRVEIPQTLVITTDVFERFVKHNALTFPEDAGDLTDDEITAAFMAGDLPEDVVTSLDTFLEKIRYPLAVRSSSILEDAQAHPSAGVYQTLMLPNNHQDKAVRLSQLLEAVKRVYASTYTEASRSFAKQSQYRTEEDKMAVIVQQICGAETDGLFYPAVSGLAQSYNFYPVSYMKPEEGIVHMALGLGRTVVDGGSCLRFSPRYPQLLPQLATVDAALANTQRYFYALKLPGGTDACERGQGEHFCKMSVDAAADHSAVKLLASTYIQDEHRVRDSGHLNGQKIMTFAALLKYDLIPLAPLLEKLLELGRIGMGGDVEIEFAVEMVDNQPDAFRFALLQIRPMTKREHSIPIDITAADRAKAFCRSHQTMGNGVVRGMADIIFVKPDRFDPARTVEIAGDIARFNSRLAADNRKYLLIGPGRWGSADRWLGIPVSWYDIAGVGAIIETTADNLQAEASQGSHFFHNITTLGLGYVTVSRTGDDLIDWPWLTSLPRLEETDFVGHVRLDQDLILKIDGKSSTAVGIKP
jgi:hypothetical protein